MAGEKILNIDDSPTVQRLIEMILSSQGYQVILASDGEEGIAKAKAEKPALVLVDFVMPKMNGYQVCKALKEDPDFKDTPIILVTSKGDKVGSKFVDVLGISEYFTKPFQPEELLSKIREVLDRRKAAQPEPRPAAPQPAEEPAAVPVHLEAAVRSVVERVLEEFVKNALPDLIRQELGRTQPAGEVGIRGNLASFRIIEVMQLLGLQRQTGRLVISHGGEEAEIFFKEGMIGFASFNCSVVRGGMEDLLRRSCRIGDESLRHVTRIAEMTGKPVDGVLAQEKVLDVKTFSDCLRRHTESVVYKAMAWKDGEFFFEKAQPPVFVNPVALKVDDLLIEGARRADEWILIQQRIPNFSAVFEPMIGNAEELTRRGLSGADMKVVSLVDGRRTVQEIIDASGLSDFDVAKSLFILLSVNLVRIKK
jgi:CheY-like chemotaxis protein